ncbi:MAG: hypothetical protein ACT4PL_00320 [Phycisphaerales bacterium]
MASLAGHVLTATGVLILPPISTLAPAGRPARAEDPLVYADLRTEEPAPTTALSDPPPPAPIPPAATPQSEKSPSPPAPPRPLEIALGKDDGKKDVTNWIGSDQPGEHAAPMASTEQPFLRKDLPAGAMLPPSAGAAPSPPPAPQATPAPPTPPTPAPREPQPTEPSPPIPDAPTPKPSDSPAENAKAAPPAPPVSETPVPPPTPPDEQPTPKPTETPPQEQPEPTPAPIASPTADPAAPSDSPAEQTPPEGNTEPPSPSRAAPSPERTPPPPPASSPLPQPAPQPTPQPAPQPTQIPPPSQPEPVDDALAKAIAELAARVNGAAPASPSLPTPPTPSGTGRDAAPPAKPGKGGDARETDEAAWLADKESDPTSTRRTAKFQAGRVDAGEGLEIITVNPRFGPTVRNLTSPRSPVFEVKFDRAGAVKRVRLLRSSGIEDVNEPVKNALFQWRARGRVLNELPAQFDGVTLRVTIILTG